MSRKIIGVTVGTTLPKPNFKQTDPTKGDYIKNKPDFEGLKTQVSEISGLVGDKSVSDQINSAISSIDHPVDSVNGKTGAVQLTATDVGALPADTEIPEVPTDVSAFNNDAGYLTAVPSEYITETELNAKGYLTEHQSLAGLATESYVNTQIAAIPVPDVSAQISTHNTSTVAHSDIRDLITTITTRLNALADSDDTTLDQMSEIVAYIKSNKSLIDGITTNKVNVSDIVNNLTTNVSNKPLSAAQGVALKALIDAITVPTKVSELTNDKGYLTSYTETDPTVPAWAKASTKPTYTKSEVGLGNVDNVKQYSASNPPPYPVTSVNGKTGAVTVSAVPTCSTSNNGQFLRVVNGVATWSTVPNAEEASF